MPSWRPEIVAAREVACWPAHLAICAEEPTTDAVCRLCQCDVALPLSRLKERPVCIYCGLDSGLVPAVEVEP